MRDVDLFLSLREELGMVEPPGGVLRVKRPVDGFSEEAIQRPRNRNLGPAFPVESPALLQLSLNSDQSRIEIEQ